MGQLRVDGLYIKQGSYESPTCGGEYRKSLCQLRVLWKYQQTQSYEGFFCVVFRLAFKEMSALEYEMK